MGKNNTSFPINRAFILLFCLITSFVTLSICSKTSFLYPIQDWVDPNCFFTTGKSMANGLVLYKDIFEQKGIILYFIHSLGYLISNTTFLGVFVFQVASFTVFLLFAYKTARLFVSQFTSLLILPFLSMLSLTSNSFASGDSAEEFCLPLFAIGIYSVLRYGNRKTYAPMPLWVMFTNGLCAGIILWIKYTLLGFWVGFALVILVWCIDNKKYKDILKYAAVFLCGVAAVSLCCLGYFIVNDAVSEMIETYFILNIFSYNHGVTVTVLEKIGGLLYQIGGAMYYSPVIALLSFIGIFGLSKSNRYLQNKTLKRTILPWFIVTLFFIFIGRQSWAYYYFTTCAFATLGCIVFTDGIVRLVNKKHKKQSALPFSKKSTVVLCTATAFIGTFILCGHTHQIGVQKEQINQYKIAKVVKQTKNATLLNYGTLDGGFYLVTDTLPITKYFCKLNVPYEAYPQMMDTQNSIIKNKEADFIVINPKDKFYGKAKDIPYLEENYSLVLSLDGVKKITNSYHLYQRKA